MPLQVPEKLNDLVAFNAALMNLKVKAPQRQAANDGKTFPIEGFVQHRSLPPRRPGADSRGAGAQPAFVDEDDGSFLLAGFFFKAGHPTRCQRRMAFSSRSTARRFRCLATETAGSQQPPNMTRMIANTCQIFDERGHARREVHKSVLYPWAAGPASNASVTC